MPLESYDAVLHGRPPKGERAAVAPYLDADETVLTRHELSALVDGRGGRLLIGPGVTVLITDRKLIGAMSDGRRFKPTWQVMTLPFGHLEPGVEVTVDDDPAAPFLVLMPSSGTRHFGARVGERAAAEGFAAALGEALVAYRRDRMNLPPP